MALWGGVECTINRVGDRYQDQLRLCGHDGRPADLDRFAELGLTALRYPLLWETFAQCSDRERLWAWHDERLDRLRVMGIAPILGLVHHGSGPMATNLLRSEFASGLAQHAGTVAIRYPWVFDWTPVNEPLTTARFSALYGHWYPHCRDETAFWLALLNQIDAVRAAMRSIRAVNPDARLIQTEDLGFTSATPERHEQASYYNIRRWASWDLLMGRLTSDHPFWPRLVGMGFADRLGEIAGYPCPPAVLGINHYLTSDRFLDHKLDSHPAASHGDSIYGPLADVEAVRGPSPPPGLAGALRDCWARYQLPIAITEVHNGCTREEQMRWFKEAWDTATALRGEGLAIAAVTAWSLLGAFDWDSLLTRNRGHYECGVFDVRGGEPRPTAMVPLLRSLAAGQAPSHPVLTGAGWWRLAASPARPVSGHRVVRPLLITGASGTLGRAFAGACRLRNIDHVVTGREVIDLGNPVSMASTLNELRPWAVVNCAGWVRVDEAERQDEACMLANFVGSVDLASACQERDIHYTSFSSDLVFNGMATRAYVESDEASPLSVYGTSKAMADDRLVHGGGRALVIRTASFFSPYDDYNFAIQLVAALRNKLPFRAATDCVMSPTYVPDLVRATLDLIVDEEVGLWHVANVGALSWADFALAIAASLNIATCSLEPVPAGAMGWIAPRPIHAELASERASIMPTLEAGIESFAAVIKSRVASNSSSRLCQRVIDIKRVFTRTAYCRAGSWRPHMPMASRRHLRRPVSIR